MLCPSTGAAGENPLKVHEDDAGIRRSPLWGKIRRCGIVQTVIIYTH